MDLTASAIKTYRYLRIAMILVVVALAVAMAIERRDAHRLIGRSCFQSSISAYYYTPVQAIFVAGMIVIGMCLVAIKGHNRLEDVALNLAGMLAPVVALVPTSDHGACASVPFVERDVAPNIHNNFIALVVTGVVAVIVAAVIAAVVSGQRGGVGNVWPKFETPDYIGLFIAMALVLGGAAWYAGWLPNRLPSFKTHAHSYSAIAMFFFLGVAAAANVWTGESAAPAKHYRAIYLAVVVGMSVSAVVVVVAAHTSDWKHAVFALEASEIVLFVTFWLAQTAELWQQGLRREA